MEKLKEMASRFALEGEVEEVVPLGAGHGTEDADGGSGEGREAVRVRRRDILADDGLYPGLENV